MTCHWGLGDRDCHLGVPTLAGSQLPCPVASMDSGQAQNTTGRPGAAAPMGDNAPQAPRACPSRAPAARAAPSLSLRPVFVENRIKTPCSWAAASRGRLWPPARAGCHQTAPSGGRENPEVPMGGGLSGAKCGMANWVLFQLLRLRQQSLVRALPTALPASPPGSGSSSVSASLSVRRSLP